MCAFRISDHGKILKAHNSFTNMNVPKGVYPAAYNMT